jgi:tRNA threonylcarbamoyladenosine biosynthesis protein TsaE
VSEHACFLEDEAATERFAHAFAAALTVNGPLMISLEGELGAGKTTLVRHLLRGLGYSGPVKSPTWSLLEPYQLASGLEIAHFDLYRLADPDELWLLGADEVLSDADIALVEWPEKAGGHFTSWDICIYIEHCRNGRRLSTKAVSSAGEKVLRQMLN